MAMGSTQTVVVCVPSDVTQVPCPAGTALAIKQAYLIDVESAQKIDASYGEFDYVYAAGIWSLAFGFVLSLYFASKGIGAVLNMIRK